MKRRILIVLDAGDALPSGFIRGLIYRDLWIENGYQVDYVARLFPPLMRFLDAPPRWVWPLMAVGFGRALLVLQRILGRVREYIIVWKARRYDVVYLVKAASYPLVSGLRRRSSARIVLDIVDALWLPKYRISRFGDILSLVDAVTTDNTVTAGYIRSFQPACTIVPDSPQIEWFDRARPATTGLDTHQCVLGWVGSGGTTYNLYAVWEALERLFARHPHLHLRLLGANPRTLPPFEKVKWSNKLRYSQQEMIDEVLGMQIGLFPLQDVDASRTRGILKATVYMAGGACLVASPVGQCADLIRHGENGLLARTTDEWECALEQLITEPETRARMAASGLNLVRDQFTVAQSFAKLRPVLDPDGVAVPAR